MKKKDQVECIKNNVIYQETSPILILKHHGMFVALFCKWLVFSDVRLSIGPMYCVFQSVQHDATCGLKPSCMKWVPSCMTWVCELSSAKRIRETAIQSAISDFHCAYVQVNLLYHAWWRGRE